MLFADGWYPNNLNEKHCLSQDFTISEPQNVDRRFCPLIGWFRGCKHCEIFLQIVLSWSAPFYHFRILKSSPSPQVLLLKTRVPTAGIFTFHCFAWLHFICICSTCIKTWFDAVAICNILHTYIQLPLSSLMNCKKYFCFFLLVISFKLLKGVHACRHARNRNDSAETSASWMPDRPFWQFWSFKICRTTFLNYIHRIRPNLMIARL